MASRTMSQSGGSQRVAFETGKWAGLHWSGKSGVLQFLPGKYASLVSYPGCETLQAILPYGQVFVGGTCLSQLVKGGSGKEICSRSTERPAACCQHWRHRAAYFPILVILPCGPCFHPMWTAELSVPTLTSQEVRWSTAKKALSSASYTVAS
eukprot:4922661-Amphidinium_carterae.2